MLSLGGLILATHRGLEALGKAGVATDTFRFAVLGIGAPNDGRPRYAGASRTGAAGFEPATSRV
jgi:hypothetical protein